MAKESLPNTTFGKETIPSRTFTKEAIPGFISSKEAISSKSYNKEAIPATHGTGKGDITYGGLIYGDLGILYLSFFKQEFFNAWESAGREVIEKDYPDGALTLYGTNGAYTEYDLDGALCQRRYGKELIASAQTGKESLPSYTSGKEAIPTTVFSKETIPTST